LTWGAAGGDGNPDLEHGQVISTYPVGSFETFNVGKAGFDYVLDQSDSDYMNGQSGGWIGGFSVAGGEPFFVIAAGNELRISRDLAVGVTNLEITATRASDGFEIIKTFPITVVNVTDEGNLPVTSFDTVEAGSFDVIPVSKNADGDVKLIGRSGGLIKFLRLFELTPGNKYRMQYTADFSLLSNAGDEAFVGFGFKDNLDFHITGLKGNGAGGTITRQIYGTAKWNDTSGFTTGGGVAPNNGTQHAAWMQIIVEPGGTYTLQTSPTGLPGTWVDEFTDADYTPISASPVAEFGIAIFLENSDKGEFELTIDNFTEIPLTPSVEALGEVSTAGAFSDGYSFTAIAVPEIDPAVDGSDPLLVAIVTSGYGGGFSRGFTSIEANGDVMNFDASSPIADGGPGLAIGSLPGKQYAGSNVTIVVRGNLAVTGGHVQLLWVKGLERDGVSLSHLKVDSDGKTSGTPATSEDITIDIGAVGLFAVSWGSLAGFTNWAPDILPNVDSWTLDSTVDSSMRAAAYIPGSPELSYTQTPVWGGSADPAMIAVSWE